MASYVRVFRGQLTLRWLSDLRVIGSRPVRCAEIDTSVRKLLSTIEAHLVSPPRNREWTAHAAMLAAEEPLEGGLYSKFHNRCPSNLFSMFGPPLTCARWSHRSAEQFLCGREGSEELPVHLLLKAIILATLLRPRCAERMEYE
jgi:hypothetical protein